MTESPSDADIIADGRVFALNCEYAHGRCTRLDFSPGNLVAFVHSLLAAKQPEPPTLETRRCVSCNGMGSTGPLGACRTCGGIGFTTHLPLAPSPAGPMREPVAPMTRCQAMIDRIILALDSAEKVWGDEEIEEIQSSLLPDMHDLLVLLDAALQYRPAAQPSPEGGEAPASQATQYELAASFEWLRSVAVSDGGARLFAQTALAEWHRLTALSRKEAPPCK